MIYGNNFNQLKSFEVVIIYKKAIKSNGWILFYSDLLMKTVVINFRRIIKKLNNK